MSHYYDASLSFLRNVPVYLADGSSTSPFAQFLTDKGALVQHFPDESTRFVITMRPRDDLALHISDAVEGALRAYGATYLHADDVRERLRRLSSMELDDRATGHLCALPVNAYVAV